MGELAFVRSGCFDALKGSGMPINFLAWKPGPRAAVIGLPFFWLSVFFLLPFLLILRISLAQMDGALVTPLTTLSDGVLTIRIHLASFVQLVSDDLYFATYLVSVKYALITATIVSMAGSIGFVGLVVPHVMRFLFGPLHRTLLIASALAGAILMVLADIASRMLIAPQSLPVGVVTALVGVPFFAVIIYRSRNK